MQVDSASPPTVEGGALSAGARLRQVREMRGESINEVSLALKLAPRQVEALESGRYEALPGLAFVRGFMRNYARYLNLDPAPLLADVEAALGNTQVDLSPVSNAAGDLPVGGRRRASAVPAGIIAAVLLVAVLGGWYFDWFDTAPPQQMAEVSVPPVAPAPTPEAGAAPTVADAPASSAMPVAAAPVSVPPAPPTPAAAAPAGAAVPPAPAAGGALAAPVEPAAEALAPGGSQLAFRFAGQSWMEVRDAAGAIVYSGTSTPGSTRNVQGRPPFALVIGNAAQVSMERDGQPVDLAPHIKGTVARLKLQ